MPSKRTDHLGPIRLGFSIPVAKSGNPLKIGKSPCSLCTKGVTGKDLENWQPLHRICHLVCKNKLWPLHEAGDEGVYWEAVITRHSIIRHHWPIKCKDQGV